MIIRGSKSRGAHVVDRLNRDCPTSKMGRSTGIVSPQTQTPDGGNSSLTAAQWLRQLGLAECSGFTDPLRQASNYMI